MDTWLIHESSILEKKKFISSKTKIRVGGGERGKKKEKKIYFFPKCLKNSFTLVYTHEPKSISY